MSAEVVVITPTKGWQPIRLRHLWSFRELAYFLVWRDIKLRYKQTLLGTSWAVLQPAITTIVFTVIFGNWLGIGGGFGGPYALFAFAAMLSWSFFSQGISQGSKSLTNAAGVISRVYFPRLLLPIGSVLAFVLDLVIGAALLLVLLPFYGYRPGLTLLAFPLFFLLLLVTTLGVTFVLGAANAQYRDVQYVTPFLVQLWFFATPVVYPVSKVPHGVLGVYSINPMVAVVSGFRWSFLGGAFPSTVELVASSIGSMVMFAVGALYFRRLERTAVDVV